MDDLGSWTRTDAELLPLLLAFTDGLGVSCRRAYTRSRSCSCCAMLTFDRGYVSCEIDTVLAMTRSAIKRQRAVTDYIM